MIIPASGALLLTTEDYLSVIIIVIPTGYAGDIDSETNVAYKGVGLEIRVDCSTTTLGLISTTAWTDSAIVGDVDG